MNFLLLKLFALSLICSASIDAYTFICLMGCRCDTNEEIIHCDDNVIRKTVPLPSHGTHLRGFSVLSLTNNNIDELPDEALLRAKFPDLKSIDVEGNKNFDCNTLKQFTTLNVLSDCGKKSGEKDDRIRVHGRPTADSENDNKNGEPRHKPKNGWKNFPFYKCDDFKRRRFDDKYVGCLWDQLHERLNEISEDYGLKALIDDIGKMFNDVGERIKKIT